MTNVFNEREHRRGLVLGLTLAEVLLLLLFLLLLALGARIQNLHAEAAKEHESGESLRATIEAELAPLLAKLKLNGDLNISSATDLATRLSRVRELEASVNNLEKERGVLSSQADLAKKLGADNSEKARSLAAAMEMAAKIDPANPAELLKRAAQLAAALNGTSGEFASNLAVATRALSAAKQINPSDPPALLETALQPYKQLGDNATAESVKNLATNLAEAAKSKDTLASLQADRDRFRRERDNLMHNGNGLTYPSCWTSAEGYTEYIFDITIIDPGFLVSNAFPSSRYTDPALDLIGDLPKDRPVSEAAFSQATRRLFNWSQQENCRFYSVVRDGTAATSKERYKKLLKTVEGHFYKLALDLNSPLPSARAGRSVPSQTANSGVGGPLVPVPNAPKRAAPSKRVSPLE